MTNDERAVERYLRVRELVHDGKVRSVPPSLLRGYQDALRRIRRAAVGQYYSGHVYVTKHADPTLITLLSKSELNSNYTLTIQ